ncbi:hypothetical protein HY091_01885 [Candidatus Kaiserbacteria bacterium]|nr:hypothetical protein [Candidatus Kaiserbacteria bacterium]
MIYLFYGSDSEKTRRKAFEWVEKAKAKEPDLVYVRLAREEMSAAALEDAALSGGLFVKRLLVLLDDPFPSKRANGEEEGEEADAASAVEDRLDILAKSDNAIIILAPKLASAKAKKIIAKAAKAYECNAPPRDEVARGFNSNLVNALAARDPKKLWLEIARALRAGDAPEQLHGLLHWKARDLMERGGRAWTPQESRALSLSLVSLLQSSRRSGLGLSDSLERFALSI